MTTQKYKIGNSAYMRQYRKKNPQKYLWYAAKYRAERKGIEFSIVPEDIIIPEFCPILGVRLNEVHNPKDDKENSPCLDRRNNGKGYTKDNVSVISFRANRLKGALTKEDLERLLQYISITTTFETTI